MKGVQKLTRGGCSRQTLCMLLLGASQDSSPFENYQAKHLSNIKFSFLRRTNSELPECCSGVLQAEMEWQKHDYCPNILYIGRNPSIANSFFFQTDVKMLNINSSVSPVQYKQQLILVRHQEAESFRCLLLQKETERGLNYVSHLPDVLLLVWIMLATFWMCSYYTCIQTANAFTNIKESKMLGPP